MVTLCTGSGGRSTTTPRRFSSLLSSSPDGLSFPISWTAARERASYLPTYLLRIARSPSGFPVLNGQPALMRRAYTTSSYMTWSTPPAHLFRYPCRRRAWDHQAGYVKRAGKNRHLQRGGEGGRRRMIEGFCLHPFSPSRSRGDVGPDLQRPTLSFASSVQGAFTHPSPRPPSSRCISPSCWARCAACR